MINNYIFPKIKENIITRNGYGSNFNELIIYDNKILKKSINSYGNEKIENEIFFYEHFLNVAKNNHDIIHLIPKINKLNLFEHSIEMEYLSNYKPLYLVFSSLNDEAKNHIIAIILKKLDDMHKTRININKTQFKNDLEIETLEKIKIRLSKVLNIVNRKPYCNVKHVNNFKIFSLNKIYQIIQKNIIEYLNSSELSYEYGMIHGDCQFNNILINQNNEMKFIDPRGYYGNSSIYGLIEYDIAKLCFALSGYDIFDNSECLDLYFSYDFDNINIDINIMCNSFIIEQSIIIKTMMCAIWLGNSHIFINDEKKCMTSYFMAMYMCSVYLQN